MLFDTVAVSAGMRGKQILVDPEKLAEYTGAEFVPLIKE